MKASLLIALVGAAYASPVTKVLDLLTGLEAKIVAEGETYKKEFEEFTAWCKDTSRTLEFEIKTGQDESAELKASIASNAASIDALTAKIEELSAGIATDEADVKAATEIRAKESADFGAEEKELSEVIETLERAVAIIEREMQKGGASMLQTAGNVVNALITMVDASMLSSADGKRLTALVQSSQRSEEDAEEDSMGAPAAAVYKSHSGGILDVLGDLSDKAKEQLDSARKTEQTSLHNFEMLKQSLEDQIKFATKDMGEAKKSLAESGESKATAEGDLDTTSAKLAADTKALEETKDTCMRKAQDYEAAKKSRSDELGALKQAYDIISESTGGAAEQTYGFNQMSFMQLMRSRLSSTVDLAKFEAVHLVRDLARKENSVQLAQLAIRMSSAMRSGADSSDPFAKVKSLISDMLEKLESEASADATQQAYCEKEMAESNEKASEKQAAIEKLTAKIDQMSARSAQLKEEVAAAQKALAELASTQAEMDKLRAEEKSTFAENKPEMEEGIEGIKMALKILREYYASTDKSHSAAEGAGTGIVSLLEVCESDFSKGLAEMVASEESAAASYEETTKENAVTKAATEKDVEYKTKEYVGLDKSINEASSDRTGLTTELDAVKEYLAKLDDMCIAKPETYAERKRRREAELAGLKQALEILDGEAVLLQGNSVRLRGVQRHM